MTSVAPVWKGFAVLYGEIPICFSVVAQKWHIYYSRTGTTITSQILDVQQRQLGAQTKNLKASHWQGKPCFRSLKEKPVDHLGGHLTGQQKRNLKEIGMVWSKV